MNTFAYLLALLLGFLGLQPSGTPLQVKQMPLHTASAQQTNPASQQRMGDPERTVKSGGGPIVVVEDTHFKMTGN